MLSHFAEMMRALMMSRFPVAAATAAAVLALAVVLSTVGGTTALWQAESRMSPGAVTTGNLMVLNGSATQQSKDFQLSDFASDALSPGVGRQAAVVVKNAGSTPFTINLSGIRSNANTQGSLLLEQFQFTIRQISTLDACPTGSSLTLTTGSILYQGLQGGASFTNPPRVGTGESLFLCLQGRLPQTAQQPSGPALFQLRFGFLAEQSR